MALLVLSAGGSAFARDEQFENAKQQLLELEPVPSRSVFLCVRGQIKNNYQSTVAHNLQKEGKDVLWALKISGLESAQMETLSESMPWNMMREYYRHETDNVQSLIQGKIPLAEYKALAKRNERRLALVLHGERERMADHEANFKTYWRLCETLSSLIITRSKLIATQN